MITVIKVLPLDDFCLELTFSNNSILVFDAKPYLTKGKLAELLDPELFKTVRPSFDTIEWANGADLDPELFS